MRHLSKEQRDCNLTAAVVRIAPSPYISFLSPSSDRILWKGPSQVLLAHVCVCACVCVLVTELCPTLWSHGLWPTRLLRPWNLQARTLERITIPFSKGCSQPRDGTWVFCIAGRFFTAEEKWKWKLFSRVQLFGTPWTIQSMEFSRPEYWSG